jgi:hypothetical protein
MAIQEIVSEIDAYIARLKEARDLIASMCTPPETSNRKPTKNKRRRKSPPMEVQVLSPSASEIAVQIIPARAPSQRRRLAKPALPTFSALGGPIPAGPVVIRSSDLARMRSVSSQVRPAVQAQQLPTSRSALDEIAQEVAKRLASGGGFA